MTEKQAILLGEKALSHTVHGNMSTSVGASSPCISPWPGESQVECDLCCICRSARQMREGSRWLSPAQTSGRWAHSPTLSSADGACCILAAPWQVQSDPACWQLPRPAVSTLFENMNFTQTLEVFVLISKGIFILSMFDEMLLICHILLKAF